MGVSSVISFLESNVGGCRRIDLRELAATDNRKVIIVDGNVFVEWYLTRNIRWVFGEIVEFVENLRNFVRAFQVLGIKLVFSFADYCSENHTSHHWNRRHNRIVNCSKSVIWMVQQKTAFLDAAMNVDYLAEENSLRLHDMICLAISVLQEMGYEVKCQLIGSTDYIANYARANNCLAILSQNSNFVFINNLNSLFLSLAHLDIETMTTKEYDKDFLSTHLKLNKKFYPLIATLLGSNFRSAESIDTGSIIRSIVCITPCTHPCRVVEKYIKEYYDPLQEEELPKILFQHIPQYAVGLIKNYRKLKKVFGYENEELETALDDPLVLNKWEQVKLKCTELCSSCILCGRINCVVDEQMFVQFPALEDFSSFPPSCYVYQGLRKVMYAILLHDAIGFVEDLTVKEWCIAGEDSPVCPVLVSPSPLDPVFHPGLLAMWDSSIEDPVTTEMKWRLFALAISSALDHRLLRYLPKSLVIPTGVLYYLYHILPTFTQQKNFVTLKPEEVEVFLVVALNLPYIDKDFLKTIPTQEQSLRAVLLISLFLQGCDIMRMLVQSCGLMLGEPSLFVWKFFDGKLFQYLYERKKSGLEILDSTSDRFIEYEQIKRIILLPPSTSVVHFL